MDQQCTATVKHWAISTAGRSSCLQPKSPPINRLIDEVD